MASRFVRVPNFEKKWPNLELKGVLLWRLNLPVVFGCEVPFWDDLSEIATFIAKIAPVEFRAPPCHTP